MDSKIVIFILGKLACAAALGQCFPLAVAVLYDENSVLAFTVSIIISVTLGQYFLYIGRKPENLSVREGTAITALSWIMISFLGLVPYWVGGYLSFLDSLFECISGFTGAGATVVADTGLLPQSILLWRALTHWFGGLGIIVIFIALFPSMGRGIVHMFNAESTGPTNDRAMPRIVETTKALFAVYIALTTAATVIFMLCGMSFLIAVEHAFSTIATGGLSPFNDSIAHFESPAIEGWIIFFMIISSANFGMYIAAWKMGWRVIVRDTEFRTFLAILVAAALAMTVDLVLQNGWSLPMAARHAFFQSTSLLSSTGFVTNDFDVWPTFSKSILLVLMFVGGCAGSTAGGFKIIRIILLFKLVPKVVAKKIHPHMVIHVSSNGDEYPEEILRSVSRYFFVYIMFQVLWTLIFVFDGIPIFDAIGVAVSSMGDCGPAFGLFGATSTYAAMPPLSKSVVCISMLMGRLESFTLLALLIPSFWHKNNW